MEQRVGDFIPSAIRVNHNLNRKRIIDKDINNREENRIATWNGSV